MEINQAWIDQQRQISEIVDMVCEDAPGSVVPLLKQIEKSQTAALDALEVMLAENERLTAERDAAVRDIRHECETCKWESELQGFCRVPCPHCDHCMKDNYNGGCYCSTEDWKWRGLCAENAPEVEK